MASSSNNDDSQPPPSGNSTASFFTTGNSKQFEFVLKLYPEVLRIRAEKRSKRPEKLVRLDDWYQNELPKLIKKRGKDAHLIHEELVQCMEWKQSRGKSYPQLSYLIKVNTPRAVMMETKKAFKKLPNIEQALTALSNLKGVGTTMASALLTAASPETAPFMADECLMAIPEIEGIDYTTKEYLNFVQHIQATVNRLNSEMVAADAAAAAAKISDDDEHALPETTKPDDDERRRTGEDDDDKKNSTDEDDSEATPTNNAKAKNKTEGTNGTAEVAPDSKRWSPHQVELALWTHYVASDLRPDLLHGLPGGEAEAKAANISSKFQQNGALDDDEETIPDGTETMRSTRILAANDDDDKEEGSSSHDEYKVQQPIVPAPVIVTDEAANDGQQIQMMNGGEALAAGNGVLSGGTTEGENSTDTAPGVVERPSTTTTAATTSAAMLNSVSSSSEAVVGSAADGINNVNANNKKNLLDAVEEGSSSQDDLSFKYKQNGATNNGDVVSTTSMTSSGSSPTSSSSSSGGVGSGAAKRFNADPLTNNVMAKCPKLTFER